MSDKGTVSSKEKETAEKRGRGRPRKLPRVRGENKSFSGTFSERCITFV